MATDPTFAQFSDVSYRTALVLYLVALAFSAAYYARRSGAAAVVLRRKQLVAVGAGAGHATTTTPDTGDEELSADIVAKKKATTRKLGGMTQSLVWLAIILQGTSVLLRGLATHRFPWGNLYEYIALTTFIAMVIAAGVLSRVHLRILWPWVLTPVISLLFYGGMKLHVAAGPVPPALKSFWLPFHVSIVSIGAGVGLISGVASVLYLLRMWQRPGQEAGFFGAIARPLPTPKVLDAIAYKTAIWALPIFGLGVVLGALWAESAWGRFWNWDPKEVVSFVTWLLYAAYLHARATSGWRDTKAAVINVVAFATMVFNLFFINLVVSGLHSYAGLN